jgi:hypothetical protein
MAGMCDMTHFISVIYLQITLAYDLTPMCMHEMLIKVGFCIVVIIDKGSTFKGEFQEMCRILKIRWHVIARANHQGLVIKRFNHFLNKSITTATPNRRHANKAVIIPATHLSAYAWNSAPIDGKGVIHSVCVVGREFRFPFNVEYMPTPGITKNNTASVLEYLSLSIGQGRFAAEILKLLLEEKRMIAREKINEGRHIVTYNTDLFTV